MKTKKCASTVNNYDKKNNTDEHHLTKSQWAAFSVNKDEIIDTKV